MIWVRADAITDYRVHIELAESLVEGSGKLLPHPVFQLSVASVALLSKVDFYTAAFYVMLALYGLTGAILYGLYFRPALSSGLPAGIGALFLSLVILLVAPITIFTRSEGHLYVGYIVPNVYHNPTINVLKPFALILLVYLLGVFSEQDYFRSNGAIGVAIILVIVAASSKPNFVFAYVPAMALMVGIRLILRQSINWKLLVVGIAIPTAIIMLLQYILFTSAEQFGRIIFAPFGYLRVWDVNSHRLLRLVLSLFFPLIVYVLYLRAALRSQSTIQQLDSDKVKTSYHILNTPY